MKGRSFLGQCCRLPVVGAALLALAVAVPVVVWTAPQPPADSVAVVPFRSYVPSSPAGKLGVAGYDPVRYRSEQWRHEIDKTNPGVCSEDEFVMAEAAARHLATHDPVLMEGAYRLELFKRVAARRAAEVPSESALASAKDRENLVRGLTKECRDVAEQTNPGVCTQVDFEAAEEAMRQIGNASPAALLKVYRETLAEQMARR